MLKTHLKLAFVLWILAPIIALFVGFAGGLDEGLLADDLALVVRRARRERQADDGEQQEGQEQGFHASNAGGDPRMARWKIAE